MIIGLMGPIGVGKTEASKILRGLGICIIDADEIAHKLIEQKSVIKKILSGFGQNVALNGKVDRKKLGEVVFADIKKLKKLNDVLHPKIKKEIKKAIKNLLPFDHIIVIDAALPCLFEGLTDKVWLVWSTYNFRVKRLLKKGLRRDKIKKIMRMQASKKEYLKTADKILHNNKTLKSLKAEIIKLAAGLGFEPR